MPEHLIETEGPGVALRHAPERVLRGAREAWKKVYSVVCTLLFLVLVIIMSEVMKRGNVGTRPTLC